jgi:hypothetical protein
VRKAVHEIRRKWHEESSANFVSFRATSWAALSSFVEDEEDLTRRVLRLPIAGKGNIVSANFGSDAASKAFHI